MSFRNGEYCTHIHEPRPRASCLRCRRVHAVADRSPLYLPYVMSHRGKAAGYDPELGGWSGGYCVPERIERSKF